ncbi:MAG: outer membrane lipoprotein carrier protein LolA [bacterium]
MLRTILIFVLTLSCYPATMVSGYFTKTENAKEILKKVKTKYSKLKTLKAEFEKVYFWELAGETQTTNGTLYLNAENHYRIEIESQIVVTDGETVWSYSKNNNQVIIDLLSNTEENPLPRDLMLKYSEDFIPHFVGEEKLHNKMTYRLNLIPKDEEAFIKSMIIWVDKASWLTIKIVQTDINDNVNSYYVKNVEQNIDLPHSLFTFEIPKDAEVVDLR